MSAPSRVHAALPMNVQAALMRAKSMPLHFYRYLQYRVGRDYHWVYRLRMDDDTLSGVIHDPATSIDVLYLDGAPAGFFELKRENDTTVDLAYFGLMAHAQGRGLGKWFLRQAIDTAWAFEPERVTVNTCTLDHHAALRLYQKMGFSPTGQSETFIHPLTDRDHVRLAKLP
ncbi:GNAT family N-acetyltransferase [Pararhizobium haloflavum]|uniref:GNAT family N-acetyltransferase n=1 Tax=Pararhizobium haloflavum TaxID=2037914 RepID=UPI000C18FB5B